jgi:hypothetical protein
MKLFITKDLVPHCLSDNIASIRIETREVAERLIDLIVISAVNEPYWFIYGDAEHLRALMHRISDAFKVSANVISVPLDYADWHLQIFYNLAQLEKHIVRSHNYTELESLTL